MTAHAVDVIAEGDVDLAEAGSAGTNIEEINAGAYFAPGALEVGLGGEGGDAVADGGAGGQGFGIFGEVVDLAAVKAGISGSSMAT